MPRYFLELSYKGTAYHGFQIQDNAPSIQGAVEKALLVLFKEGITLTGSSRTDAGVHALQNYFHFDTDRLVTNKHVYNLNAILPEDIAVRSIKAVADTAHCRFDAIARAYNYYIYQEKNPFYKDRGWFYPYALDFALLQQAAAVLKRHADFTSFAKRNTQVFTHNCNIHISEWSIAADQQYIYHVQANRFLRGMVRGLVGTMLKVGRRQMSLDEFENIILSKDCTKADFSTPPQGLFLVKVVYP